MGMGVMGDAEAVRRYCKAIGVEKLRRNRQLAYKPGVYLEITALVINEFLERTDNVVSGRRAEMMEKRIGQVTHYFKRIGVAVLELKGGLKVGDVVHIQGHITDFTQPVESMEIEHQKVQSVGPGADVALRVNERVRRGDAVYNVVEE
jgi:hypothetical protein